MFSFYFVGDEKNIKIFNSNIEGKIIEIIYKDKLLEEQNIYINNDVFANIKPYNLPDKEKVFYNSCNTHPHNSYFQLLAETGIIGFFVIFTMFLYLSYLIAKIVFNLFVLKKRDQNDLEICLIVYFFVLLWPLIPTGNF